MTAKKGEKQQRLAYIAKFEQAKNAPPCPECKGTDIRQVGQKQVCAKCGALVAPPAVQHTSYPLLHRNRYTMRR